MFSSLCRQLVYYLDWPTTFYYRVDSRMVGFDLEMSTANCEYQQLIPIPQVTVLFYLQIQDAKQLSSCLKMHRKIMVVGSLSRCLTVTHLSHQHIPQP